MNNFSPLDWGLFVLAIEFGLVACGIAFVAGRRTRQMSIVQNAEVSALVGKVDSATGTRREALSAIISETYRFDSADTERVVTDFIERERAFYNAMIGVHLGRNNKTLADVPSELAKVVAPWLRLTPKNSASPDTVVALETENATLNRELTDTKRVLEELMEEYNALYHQEQQARARLVAPSSSLLNPMNSDSTLPLKSDNGKRPIEIDPIETQADPEQPGEIIALDLDGEELAPVLDPHIRMELDDELAFADSPATGLHAMRPDR